MNSVIIELPDEHSTIELGKRLANLVKVGLIISLEGELGAGKTTLCRGIVAGLGGDPAQVTSPTFTIVNEYDAGTFVMQHCDFTRLPKDDQLEDLGGTEFFFGPYVYVLEWFSRVGLEKKTFKKRIITAMISYNGLCRSISISGDPAFNLKLLK